MRLMFSCILRGLECKTVCESRQFHIVIGNLDYVSIVYFVTIWCNRS